MKVNNLNPNYTFDNFIIGDFNKFSYMVAYEVANKPAEKYNPLVIYGKNGLGKTHLMHAIGNRILQNNPKSKIVYVTSEKFTNNLIDFKNIDVLLMDNIQFIEGNEKIQERLLNIFNNLYYERKQIVLASDKHPHDIPEISARLKTRFEWGVVVDISTPDFETKLEIMNKYANNLNLDIDKKILQKIAQINNLNIRELEGILNQLLIQSTLNDGIITTESIENIISLYNK